MKTKIEYWKVTKRGALIALSICCIAALNGCDGDGGDDNNGETAGIELTNLYSSSISVFLDGELLMGPLASGETAFAAVPPGEYLLQYKRIASLEWLGQYEWTHWDHKQRALVDEEGELVML